MKVIVKEPVFCHDVVAHPEVQLDEDGNAKFGGFNPVLQPSDVPVEVPAGVGADWIKRGIAEAHEDADPDGDAADAPSRKKKEKGF